MLRNPNSYGLFESRFVGSTGRESQSEFACRERVSTQSFRRNLKTLEVVLLAGVLSSQAQIPSGAAVPNAAKDYFARYALPIRFGAHIEGPGFDLLRTETSKSDFFFLGEEHDTVEVPRLSEALWPELYRAGFRHIALEAGEWLGNRLDRSARGGDEAALEQFREATWPRLPKISVPPISDEDLSFYRSVRQTAKGSREEIFWGIDSEFRLAPLLGRLYELTPRGVKRRHLQKLWAQVQERESQGQRNPESIRDELLQTLKMGPRARPGSEQWYLTDALHRAVSDFATRPAKELFVRDYREAQSHGEVAPQVFLRRGSYHASRGLMRDFGTSTLANFVAEFGNTEHRELLNMLFFSCTAASSATDYSKPRRCLPEELVWLSSFDKTSLTDDGVVVDLRPLRQEIRPGHLEVPWEFWQLIQSFDVICYVPQTHAATLSEPEIAASSEVKGGGRL